jgi:sec-independent protein translocase protein TatA
MKSLHSGVVKNISINTNDATRATTRYYTAMFGWLEVILIAAALLIVFGGAKLPGIAGGIGKAIKNFKRSLRGDDDIQVHRVEEPPKTKKEEEDI